MAAAARCAAPSTQRYQRRRPERTLWYRMVRTNLETWLELSTGEDSESPPAYVERTFRRYLECGIFAHGFARAYCDECQHDFLIAYSCKGRGVCPSCNTRRMAETAAHLVDHVFPPLPVRQWVLAVPKRMRYFLQRDAALQGAVLGIFLRVVERCLREHICGCPAAARIGTVAFIHRFGSSLNEHVHFHCCVLSATHRCASSPLSTMPAPWGRFSITSANRPSPRASHPRVGHRRGRRPRRRPTIRNATYPPNPYRTSNSISASPGRRKQRAAARHGVTRACGPASGRRRPLAGPPAVFGVQFGRLFCFSANRDPCWRDIGD